MDINQILDSIYTISVHSKLRLRSRIETLTLPKHTILLKANRVEQAIYFIRKGIVRAYSEHEAGEITFWFGEEGETILSMRSYVEQQPSYEHIELLEDCELYKISTADLNRLYREDIEIANWGRKFAERELLKIERRMISRELLSAKQRYEQLMDRQASLLLRVPLKYIASYLGITQVSLSRIRGAKG